MQNQCFLRALCKCHLLPQMHQETHNQFKDFGKNDHCMCQKQKRYSRAVKDSNLLEMTSLKKLPSETRTEALLVKYVVYFGICQ